MNPRLVLVPTESYLHHKDTILDTFEHRNVI
jgi:hypothetical protein